MPLPRSWMQLFLALALVSCHQTADDIPPRVSHTLAAVDSALPSLTLTVSTNNPTAEDVSRYARIVVGPSGQLLFISPREPNVLTLRDSQGTVVNFGPLGNGPREVQDPLGFELTDSLVTVFDRANARLSRWSLDGSFHDERRVDLPISTEVTPLGDGRYLIPGAIRDRVRLAIVDGATGELDEIDISSDSFVTAHWPSPRQTTSNPPAVGTWYDGFVVADRMNYAVAFLDWSGARVGIVDQGLGENTASEATIARLASELQATGRALSPGARTRLASEPQPWFSRRIRADAKGRTWLIGQINDRAYADIYWGPTLLGRIWLACNELGPYWDLNGEWLALICEPDDPAILADAVVKLFRIVAGPPPATRTR